MVYHIKIQNFEGPFDLLFHLIEKSEVDIYDIPIADITKQYLEYIAQMQNLDLEVASEFIVMAATLIQIKSRMLLPKEVNPLDEIAVDSQDPRTELVEKLLEYKKFKEVSEQFKEREENYFNVFFKNAEIIDDIETDKILLNVSLQDIVKAFNNIVEKHNKTDNLSNLKEQIIREEFTVDDKINYIRNHIKVYQSINFNDLFYNSAGKLEVIITFLALLEMMRLKEIKIFQNKTYGDIIISYV